MGRLAARFDTALAMVARLLPLRVRVGSLDHTSATGSEAPSTSAKPISFTVKGLVEVTRSLTNIITTWSCRHPRAVDAREWACDPPLAWACPDCGRVGTDG